MMAYLQENDSVNMPFLNKKEGEVRKTYVQEKIKRMV